MAQASAVPSSIPVGTWSWYRPTMLGGALIALFVLFGVGLHTAGPIERLMSLVAPVTALVVVLILAFRQQTIVVHPLLLVFLFLHVLVLTRIAVEGDMRSMLNLTNLMLAFAAWYVILIYSFTYEAPHGQRQMVTILMIAPWALLAFGTFAYFAPGLEPPRSLFYETFLDVRERFRLGTGNGSQRAAVQFVIGGFMVAVAWKTRNKPWFYASLLLLTMVFILGSKTRIGLIGLLALVAFCVQLYWPRLALPLLLAFLATITVVTASLTSPTFSRTMTHTLQAVQEVLPVRLVNEGADTIGTNRELLNQAILAEIPDHFWTGAGRQHPLLQSNETQYFEGEELEAATESGLRTVLTYGVPYGFCLVLVMFLAGVRCILFAKDNPLAQALGWLALFSMVMDMTTGRFEATHGTEAMNFVLVMGALAIPLTAWPGDTQPTAPTASPARCLADRGPAPYRSLAKSPRLAWSPSTAAPRTSPPRDP